MAERRKRVEKPIRLGLVGCGGIVRINHAPIFLSLADSVKVVALADVVDENLENLASTFNVPPSGRYSDYRDMLAKAEIDAVSIATPHHLHGEHVIAAAEAGVAVISEKPMATSLAEADEILSAVKRNDVAYTVSHNLLFALPMQEAFVQLGAGVLGQPVFGRSQSMGLKPADFSADHSNPALAWRASKAAGGGCINDSAYHEIYSVVGMMGSPVRYVEARVKNMLLDVDVDDLAMMIFEHRNGALSTVSSSWCSPLPERGRWCEVHTANGSVRVTHRPDNPLMRFSREDGEWKSLDVPGWDERKVIEQPGLDGHSGFFAAAFDALANGAEMPVSAEQGRHIIAIIAAARRATEERRAIEVD